MQPTDARVAAALSGSVLEASGADLVLAESRHPGGGTDPPTFIAPLHTHRRDDEVWYVLDGTLRFRLGGETVEAAVIMRSTPSRRATSRR
jgi:mannose-6-phosphate isomerase-like protein (cupin superfamily)